MDRREHGPNPLWIDRMARLLEERPESAIALRGGGLRLVVKRDAIPKAGSRGPIRLPFSTGLRG